MRGEEAERAIIIVSVRRDKMSEIIIAVRVFLRVGCLQLLNNGREES